MAKAHRPSPCCGRRSIVRSIWLKAAHPEVPALDDMLSLTCSACGLGWTEPLPDDANEPGWYVLRPEGKGLCALIRLYPKQRAILAGREDR
jgi:hypothetical protein